MECILCYEDVESLPICTYFDGTIEKSEICIDCLNKGLNDMLDNTIKQFANEECEASIKRIVKSHLPTHITMDMTGRGKKISYITYNGTVISGKLNSTYSDNEIHTMNMYIDVINEYAINDDSNFLLKHKEYFEQYK